MRNVAILVSIFLGIYLFLWLLKLFTWLEKLISDPTSRDFGLELAKLISSSVGTVGAIAAAFGVILNIKIAQKNIKLAEDKLELERTQGEARLITDRFTKAIEQLGNAKTTVGIGGIYALERIAIDSPRDHWTVMEVLTSFIREKSSSTAFVTEDIQAALTVVARREVNNDSKSRSLDLSHANLQGSDLRGAKLNGANLTGVNFKSANLENAHFVEAHLDSAKFLEVSLSGANFHGAKLRGAIFREVNLDNTDFRKSDLEVARFYSCKLRGAKFERSNLRATSFYSCKLRGAKFEGADFTGAEFVDTQAIMGEDMQSVYEQEYEKNYGSYDEADYFQCSDLDGVDFRGVIGLTPEQIKNAGYGQPQSDGPFFDEAFRKQLIVPEHEWQDKSEQS